MKKYNILYIDTGYECGGGTKSFLYLLEYLNKDKYNSYVFFENNYKCQNKYIKDIISKYAIFLETDIEKQKISKIKKEFLRIISKTFLKKKELSLKLEYAYNVLKIFKDKFNIDLIHLNNHFGTNLEYIVAADRLDIKVIQHLRKNSSLSNFEVCLLKKMNFITISVSISTYNFYSKFLKIDKNIIYNPFLIDIKAYNKKWSNKIKVLFPANYLENKGHILVFKALKNTDNIILYLAGNGKFDKETLKFKDDLKDKIIELGFVDLDKWYREVDYVISFSKNEGLPRVIIEGLLYGCGIISSDFDVAKEIYEISHKNNFFIIKRNSEELERLFKSLNCINYKIPDENIKKVFSINNYIYGIENLYKSLLQNPQ